MGTKNISFLISAKQIGQKHDTGHICDQLDVEAQIINNPLAYLFRL